MTLITTVIDDKSPLIQYDATWLPGTSQDDNYAVDYYEGTFQKNSAADGTATFSFNGTAIWIYGANRPNHGLYTVQLDSQTYPSVNGSGNNLFQQSLFNANVDQAAHTVTLVNTGGSSGLYVDIDMIVWQSEVGSSGDQLVPELVQDTDSRFQYQQTAWEATSSSGDLNLNLFNNGTGHVTDAIDASVSFTFTVREAVTLFGTSGPSNGPYAVQLDGGESITYNATNAYPTNYGVTVYHADNLGPGEHQVVLTNLPSAAGQYLTIDYAQLWDVANSSNSTSVSSCIPSSSDYSVQEKLSSGVIAGLVIEGVIAVLAAAAAAFFYRRWRTTLAASRPPYSPVYGTQNGSILETATATGIAPTLETRNSPRNDTFVQPFTAVRQSSYHQLDNNDRVTSNSLGDQLSAGAERVLNEGRTAGRKRTAGVRNNTGLPGGQRVSGTITSEDADDHPPPGYDTAVRGPNTQSHGTHL